MVLSPSGGPAQNLRPRTVPAKTLRESLRILQLPLPQLREEIDAAVLENPVLEYAESPGPGTGRIEDAGRGVGSGAGQETDVCWHDGVFPAARPRDEEERADLFASVAWEPTFSDFLLEQLGELKISPLTAKICRYIIGNLDERGYLSSGAEEMARELGISPSYVHKALDILRQLEPAGVGASDLRECLMLQLRRRPDCDPVLLKIAGDCLNLLASNKIKEIARRLSIPVGCAQRYCNQIRELDPYPSNGFHTQGQVKFLIPEAVIRRRGAGDFEIEANSSFLPRLRISETYLLMRKSTNDPALRKYLREKIEQAGQTIQSLSYRRETVRRVIKNIVEYQLPYFEKGALYVKPMLIEDLARRLNLSESTVSRAVQGKYILCPSGIVGLRAFFSVKLDAGGGNATSAASVRQRILELVKSENRERPLSDQEIARRLGCAGIPVSRRAVTKYRQSLDIPPSSMRKTVRSCD